MREVAEDLGQAGDSFPSYPRKNNGGLPQTAKAITDPIPSSVLITSSQILSYK